LTKESLYGYSTGPMVSGSNLSYIDVKMLNNDRQPARVRIKQYDLLPSSKNLWLDYSLEVVARGSIYAGLILLDTWEVQFICNSPLVRFWVGGLDNDLNLEAGSVLHHNDLIRFMGNSLHPISGKRHPELLLAGYRR